MTRWERIGWVMQAVLLGVMVASLLPHLRSIPWLSGAILGAGIGGATLTLIWWPMVVRARKSRDTWIHNAMVAKSVLEGLADIMHDGDDGKNVH